MANKTGCHPLPSLELPVWGEECGKRDPLVQRGLLNPEGVHRLKTVAYILGPKPAVFRDLSSVLRERYVREPELTML